jgi:hypothetical protein
VVHALPDQCLAPRSESMIVQDRHHDADSDIMRVAVLRFVPCRSSPLDRAPSCAEPAMSVNTYV